MFNKIIKKIINMFKNSLYYKNRFTPIYDIEIKKIFKEKKDV